MRMAVQVGFHDHVGDARLTGNPDQFMLNVVLIQQRSQCFAVLPGDKTNRANRRAKRLEGNGGRQPLPAHARNRPMCPHMCAGDKAVNKEYSIQRSIDIDRENQ